MVLDGLKAYVQLANGLTDVTRERAVAAARSLVAQGEASMGIVVPESMREQVGSLTEDLIATSRANRDLLVGLVRAEVERSVSLLGLVSAAELSAAASRAEALGDRVHELERALRAAEASARPAKKATAKKSTAKKTATKKSTAKKTAKKATAKKSTTKKATKKTAAKKATKTAAKKSTAKTSTAAARGPA
ncbi:MAG: hypothetical protein QOJ90_1359 [Actinomycetota bacterium]|nr:hypothetical protein [Actinomycetota bacterium]